MYETNIFHKDFDVWYLREKEREDYMSLVKEKEHEDCIKFFNYNL